MFSLEFFAEYALAAHAQKIVVTGMVGTEEIPLCFLELVTLLSQQRTLLVALDLPNESELCLYLAGEINEDELLAAPFWRRFDGRSSCATLNLLRELRALHHHGKVKIALVGEVSQDRGEELFTALESEDVDCIVALVQTEERWKLCTASIWSLQIQPTWGSAWYCTRFGCGARPLPWYYPRKGTPAKDEGTLERYGDRLYTLWIAPSTTSFPALM